MAISGGGQEARDQALALARRTPLPVTARSLTEKEVAKIDGRAVPILICIYGAVAIPLLAIAAFAGGAQNGTALAVAAAVIAAIGALLWLIGRRRARRRSDYRDPQIVIELKEGGAVLRSPGRVDELGYAEAIVSYNIVRMNRVPHFMGLVLESPLGPLRLDDLWFKPGRTAAAALAGRLEEQGVLPGAG